MASSTGSINQKFKIELFQRNKVKFIIKHKNFINKDKTKSFSIISPKSKIKFYEKLEKDLIDYFNKEKAKLKILIGIFDDDMTSSISLFVENIKKITKLSKNHKIILSSNASYIPSIENALSYEYLPKNMSKNDLANCYCYVKENQKVISYTTGIKGKSGVNIYGNYIKASQIRNKQDLFFNVSKNLEIINNNEDSQVIAKTEGVLIFKNEEFDITNNLSFDSLDFKAVRYFNIPLNIEDVVININSKVEFQNAVNSGVTLKAHNINIRGDIDSKTTIIAVNLSCNGNIHHSAILRAKNANLKILKGKLKAENAKIKTIENGLVIANNVEVDKIVGGEIRAKEIKISFLYSNNIIKGSEVINILNMEGNNNTIHMSMNADLDIKKDIKRYQEELPKIKEIPQKNIPIIKNKYIEHKKKDQILQAQLKEISSNKGKIQKSIILNQNIINALEKDINALNYKNNLITNLKKIDEFLYQTKIILKNGFNGDNIIVCDYVHTKKSIKTIPNKFVKYISLVNEGNKDIFKLS
jgi:hypothetical protein